MITYKQLQQAGLMILATGLVSNAEPAFAKQDATTYAFPAEKASTLFLDTYCANISILKNSTTASGIEIKANDAGVTARREGNEIIVEQDEDSCSDNTQVFTDTNGNVVIYGSNNGMISRFSETIVIVNGRVIRENKHRSQHKKRKGKVNIVINAPDEMNLSADLNGNSSLRSDVTHDQALVSMNGVGSVKVTAKEAEANLLGSGSMSINIKGGDFSASISGSGDITSRGNYKTVTASIMGSGNIMTSGFVDGNYFSQISGSGNIHHVGSIQGKKRNSITGSGNFRHHP